MLTTARYGQTGDHVSVHDIPGRAMGIWAFVLSFILQPLALILGVVSLRTSRRAALPNGLAVAAIVISVVLVVGAGLAALVIAASIGSHRIA